MPLATIRTARARTSGEYVFVRFFSSMAPSSHELEPPAHPGRFNVDSPASGSGPIITAGWHTLVRVWDGREVRQYVDGLRTNTVAVTATGGWSIYRWGWQFSTSQALDEAYVPFFGAFGAAWDDPMVARWSADPLGMLWPERDTTLVPTGGGNGGPPAAARRPVLVFLGG